MQHRDRVAISRRFMFDAGANTVSLRPSSSVCALRPSWDRELEHGAADRRQWHSCCGFPSAENTSRETRFFSEPRQCIPLVACAMGRLCSARRPFWPTAQGADGCVAVMPLWWRGESRQQLWPNRNGNRRHHRDPHAAGILRTWSGEPHPPAPHV